MIIKDFFHSIFSSQSVNSKEEPKKYVRTYRRIVSSSTPVGIVRMVDSINEQAKMVLAVPYDLIELKVSQDKRQYRIVSCAKNKATTQNEIWNSDFSGLQQLTNGSSLSREDARKQSYQIMENEILPMVNTVLKNEVEYLNNL